MRAHVSITVVSRELTVNCKQMNWVAENKPEALLLSNSLTIFVHVKMITLSCPSSRYRRLVFWEFKNNRNQMYGLIVADSQSGLNDHPERFITRLI